MHVLQCSSCQPDGAPSADGSMHVIGLGDPVMDILVHISHELLSSVAEHAGGCIPIDSKELTHLLAVTSETSTPTRCGLETIIPPSCGAFRLTKHTMCRIPGGSAANVIRGLANLSAGSMRCQFAGMVGRDHTAQEYAKMLQQQGVEPILVVRSRRTG